MIVTKYILFTVMTVLGAWLVASCVSKRFDAWSRLRGLPLPMAILAALSVLASLMIL